MIIIGIILIVFLLYRYKRNQESWKKGLAILDAVLAGLAFVLGFVLKFLKRLFSL
jgi:multisubunit Na+/H+ antiporter MnhB subunit